MPGLLWRPRRVNQRNLEFGVNCTGKYQLLYFDLFRSSTLLIFLAKEIHLLSDRLSVAIMAEPSTVSLDHCGFTYEESATPVIAGNGWCGGTTQAPLRCTRRALRKARWSSPCAGASSRDRRGAA